MQTTNKKFCPECRTYLPIGKFKKLTSPSALKKYPDGYYWCCGECFKNKTWVYTPDSEPTDRKARRRLKRQKRIDAVESTYGLSEAEYLSKIAEQSNSCAICGGKDEGKVLCIDHNHVTGKVRGLLCNNCNIGLGNFKDNIKVMNSAIGYLQKYSTRPQPPEKG